MDKRKVFVYGTLKQGFGNHRVMERAKSSLIGTFKTLPEFTMLHLGGFPGIIDGGHTAITGELWEVEEIEGLDALEGHPTFYRRTEILLEGYDQPVEAYILNSRYGDGQRKEIDSGVWK